MIASLLNLYPGALLNPVQAPAFGDYYLFSQNGDAVHIPFKELDPGQQQVLDIFNQIDQIADQVPQRASLETTWYDYLYQKSSVVPSDSERVRFLHLDFYSQADSFDYTLWQDTLKQAVEAFVVAVALNERRVMIVLDEERLTSESIAQLSGLLTTLDDDFDVITRGLLGQIQTVNTLLPTLFDYEQTLFSHSIQADSFTNLQTLSNVILRYIGNQALEQQPLLANLRQVIVANSEYTNTIKALFERQGNLTQAAEQLFVHRNTLTYRMTKFTKETGFNLQYLPDLILCYLVID